MKNILLVFLAFIMLSATSCNFMQSINPFGKKKREAMALQEQREAYRIADSIRVVREQEAEAERLRQAELAREAEEQAVVMAGHHVIVGSFLTPEYADAWLEHIRGIGYDATIVDMDGGRWKLVSAASFPQQRQAYNALPSITERVDGEAWVWNRQ